MTARAWPELPAKLRAHVVETLLTEAAKYDRAALDEHAEGRHQSADRYGVEAEAHRAAARALEGTS